MDQVKFFKVSPLQILRGPFLNTLTQITISQEKKANELVREVKNAKDGKRMLKAAKALHTKYPQKKKKLNWNSNEIKLRPKFCCHYQSQ